MPIMFDLETVYDTKSKYDLKHMSMSEYCYDKRAKCHCMAWLNTDTGEEGCEWDMQKVEELLANWYHDQEVMIAYNTQFDAQFILANKLGPLQPKKLFCAQMMALHILGVKAGHSISLKTVGALLNTRVTKYEGKGDTASFDGIYEIPEDLRPDVSRYALDDVRTLADIVNKIANTGKLGNAHLATINWAIRQYCFPKLKLDLSELQGTIAQEKSEREIMLSRVGQEDPSIFRSVARWVELMEEHGVKVPMKKNPKGEEIPQAAKNDPFILENINRPDDIGNLVKARVLYSSNIVHTRAESYEAVAKLDINGVRAWPMHVWPSGAHTHRLTGKDGGGGNPLNIDKNLAEKKFGIRNAISPADPKDTLIVFDYTGIELRVARWLVRDAVSIDAISEGRDLYKVFASMAYNVPYKDVNKEQRFIGKQAELALQYGLGHVKYQARLAQAGVHVSIAEANEVVEKFRKHVHAPIRKAWYILDDLLGTNKKGVAEALLSKLNMPNHTFHPAEGFRWPSGRLLSYYGKKMVDGKFGDECLYFPRAPWGDMTSATSIWGGTLLENMAQSIVNDIIDERKRRIEHELGVDVAMEVYDEMVVVAPRNRVGHTAARIQEIASSPISWWPDGPPLEIEIQICERYGDVAK